MKKGDIFVAIIFFYVVFIFLYGLVVIGINDGLSATFVKNTNMQIRDNVTHIGNITITSQYTSLNQATGCGQNDVIGCVSSVVGLMFSLDSVVTPFAMFNYLTLLFTILFIIAIVKEIGIPLVEAIIP